MQEIISLNVKHYLNNYQYQYYLKYFPIIYLNTFIKENRRQKIKYNLFNKCQILQKSHESSSSLLSYLISKDTIYFLQIQKMSWGQQQQGGWGNPVGQGQGYGGQQGQAYGAGQGFAGQGQGFGGQGQGFVGQGFIPNPNQSYKIVSSVHPNLCIDSSGNPATQGMLILYNYHGGDNQRFRFVPDNNGHYHIVNVGDEGPITSDVSNPNPGEQCYIDDNITANSNRWSVLPAHGEATGKGFAIILAGKGFCLDISGGKYYNDTPIVTWYNQGKPNQTWQILSA